MDIQFHRYAAVVSEENFSWLRLDSYPVIKKYSRSWTGDVAQRLRALAALEEDLGSTHSTTWQLTAVYHSSFREFDTLTQIYVQAKHQHT